MQKVKRLSENLSTIERDFQGRGDHSLEYMRAREGRKPRKMLK